MKSACGGARANALLPSAINRSVRGHLGLAAEDARIVLLPVRLLEIVLTAIGHRNVIDAQKHSGILPKEAYTEAIAPPDLRSEAIAAVRNRIGHQV